MFKGCITAMITPLSGGQIDWEAFEKFIEWQIEQGVHGLVPCGTTGESPTLSHDEHNAIIKRCVEVVKGRIPVLAGTGSNSTREAIEFTQAAKDAGADGALVVAPYYNRPTQEGLYEHFKSIHNAVDLPIVLYNVPSRSAVDIDNETVIRLAKLPRIVGIKDASGDLSRPLEITRETDKDFIQLSGDDITSAAFMAQGGEGVISVVSNVAPLSVAGLYDAWICHEMRTFEMLRDQLGPLGAELFYESSPAPVKYAASLLGLCSPEVRMPLLTATVEAQERVQKAMRHAGLI
ncbi:MAG: 4-hydroxy-tetrahydrodipicolinate synthase [Micavibrio sp.]|nr:4-hydroxy-tetrahydrodipicolinate synthase [Micavibrio sp.]